MKEIKERTPSESARHSKISAISFISAGLFIVYVVMILRNTKIRRKEELRTELKNFVSSCLCVQLNPNRSLGPISSGDVKVFSCSPESKECLPLIYGSHKT